VMEGRTGANDKFARFVGTEAYEAAGGALTRDLFGGSTESGEGDIYFEDSGLLHRLATEKLEAEAAPYREQGWKWVEVQPDITQSDLDRQSRISTSSHGLAPDSDAARLFAGVILGIDRDGQLSALTGILKPEDAKAIKRAQARKESEPRTGEAQVSPSSPNAHGGALSASLVEALTAEKTAALRAMIAKRPDVALALVVHDLALPLFYEPWDSTDQLTTLKANPTDVAAFLTNGVTRKALVEINAAIALWRERLPDKSGDLWPWLKEQQRDVVLELLAIAVAANVDAIRYRHERTVPVRLVAGNRLAHALALDMKDWWEAEAEFLSRISKAAILSAIGEAVSPEAARSLDRSGKSELVAVAERRLKGTGWLPAPLRSSALSDEASDVHKDIEGVGVELAHSAATG
jgi:ParB family chromosome partitioning protein